MVEGERQEKIKDQLKDINFEGFEIVSYTQTPDIIYDVLLKVLNGAELKMLMCIVRKTFGFRKYSDNISLSQISDMTGLSRVAVFKACNFLEETGVINVKRQQTKEKGYISNTYSLHFRSELSSLDKKFTQGSSKNNLGLGKKVNIQQTSTVTDNNRYRYVFNNRDVRDVVSFFDNLFPEHKGTLRFKDVRAYLGKMEKNQLVANIGALKFNVKRNPAGYLRTVFEKGDGKVRVSKEGGKRKMMEETQKKVQQWKEELRKSKERRDKLRDIYKKLPEETKQKIRLKAENIIGNTLKFGRERLVELEILGIVEEEYQK